MLQGMLEFDLMISFEKQNKQKCIVFNSFIHDMIMFRIYTWALVGDGLEVYLIYDLKPVQYDLADCQNRPDFFCGNIYITSTNLTLLSTNFLVNGWTAICRRSQSLSNLCQAANVHFKHFLSLYLSFTVCVLTLKKFKFNQNMIIATIYPCLDDSRVVI